MNDLGSGLPSDGPMHLVLHRFEKEQADILRGVVVNARRVNVCDLLVEAPLRGADVLNPAHQLFEVIEGLIGILQTLIVEHEALDDVLPQPLRCPNSKLRAPQRLHSVADRDDDIEVVELRRIVLAIGGSCQGFLDN